MNIILIVNIVAVLWFLFRFKYARIIRCKIVDILYGRKTIVTDLMAELLSCLICISFWFTLFYAGFVTACIVSLIAMIITMIDDEI